MADDRGKLVAYCADAMANIEDTRFRIWEKEETFSYSPPFSRLMADMALVIVQMLDE